MSLFGWGGRGTEKGEKGYANAARQNDDASPRRHQQQAQQDDVGDVDDDVKAQLLAFKLEHEQQQQQAEAEVNGLDMFVEEAVETLSRGGNRNDVLEQLGSIYEISFGREPGKVVGVKLIQVLVDLMERRQMDVEICGNSILILSTLTKSGMLDAEFIGGCAVEAIVRAINTHDAEKGVVAIGCKTLYQLSLRVENQEELGIWGVKETMQRVRQNFPMEKEIVEFTSKTLDLLDSPSKAFRGDEGEMVPKVSRLDDKPADVTAAAKHDAEKDALVNRLEEGARNRDTESIIAAADDLCQYIKRHAAGEDRIFVCEDLASADVCDLLVRGLNSLSKGNEAQKKLDSLAAVSLLRLLIEMARGTPKMATSKAIDPIIGVMKRFPDTTCELGADSLMLLVNINPNLMDDLKKRGGIDFISWVNHRREPQVFGPRTEPCFMQPLALNQIQIPDFAPLLRVQSILQDADMDRKEIVMAWNRKLHFENHKLLLEELQVKLEHNVKMVKLKGSAEEGPRAMQNKLGIIRRAEDYLGDQLITRESEKPDWKRAAAARDEARLSFLQISEEGNVNDQLSRVFTETAKPSAGMTDLEARLMTNISELMQQPFSSSSSKPAVSDTTDFQRRGDGFPENKRGQARPGYPGAGTSLGKFVNDHLVSVNASAKNLEKLMLELNECMKRFSDETLVFKHEVAKAREGIQRSDILVSDKDVFEALAERERMSATWQEEAARLQKASFSSEKIDAEEQLERHKRRVELEGLLSEIKLIAKEFKAAKEDVLKAQLAGLNTSSPVEKEALKKKQRDAGTQMQALKQQQREILGRISKLSHSSRDEKFDFPEILLAARVIDEGIFDEDDNTETESSRKKSGEANRVDDISMDTRGSGFADSNQSSYSSKKSGTASGADDSSMDTRDSGYADSNQYSHSDKNKAKPLTVPFFNEHLSLSDFVEANLTGEAAKLVETLQARFPLAQIMQLKEEEQPKLLRPISREGFRAVQDSIGVVNAIHHPNILPIESAFYDDYQKAIFLQTPLRLGGSLKEWLRSERRLIEYKLSVLSKIADALGGFHKLNVVQGGVKMENVVMDSRSNDASPALCDYPFSKSDVKTVDFASLYLAPEIEGDLHFTMESDVWSFIVLCLIVLVFDGVYPAIPKQSSSYIDFENAIKVANKALEHNALQPLLGLFEGVLISKQNRPPIVTIRGMLSVNLRECIACDAKSYSYFRPNLATECKSGHFFCRQHLRGMISSARDDEPVRCMRCKAPFEESVINEIKKKDPVVSMAAAREKAASMATTRENVASMAPAREKISQGTQSISGTQEEEETKLKKAKLVWIRGQIQKILSSSSGIARDLALFGASLDDVMKEIALDDDEVVALFRSYKVRLAQGGPSQ